jgi:alpha-tubulin suppressor-like RCC1 family protein
MRKNLVFKIVSSTFLLCLLPLSAIAQSPLAIDFPFGFGVLPVSDVALVRKFAAGAAEYSTAPMANYAKRPEISKWNLPINQRTNSSGWRDNMVARNATGKVAQASGIPYLPNGIVREVTSTAELLSFAGTPVWIEQDFPLQAGSYKIGLQAVVLPGCANPELRILVNGAQLGSTFSPTGEALIFTSSDSFEVSAESVNVVRIEATADSDTCTIEIDDLRVIAQPKTATVVPAISTAGPGSTVAAVTAATASGAPTIGTAIRGNASATVAFTAPASDGGSVITSYKATSTPGSLTKTCTAPCSSITVTGLTNGTVYTFKVTATNAIGTSVSSAASNSVTPLATLPGVPIIGTATAGNLQATVTFTAPATNGGSTITSYTATSQFGNKTGSCTAPCTSITVTGLVNGTAYTFTVKATNVNGASALSVASNSVTPAALPGAPTIGTATAGNALATVTFTAPASNGGSAVTSYTATSVVGAKTGTCTAPCTSINVTTLTNGTAYTFTVKATNAIGSSVASAASNSVTPAAAVTVPAAPTIGTATAGNASATVTFVAPASNGGSAITSYIATSVLGGLTGTCAAPCTSIVVSGLTNGTAYTFKVSAINAIGTGAQSAASNSVTPAVVLLSQTITGFAPTTPIPYSAGATFTLTATGGASGNPVVFATTSPTICSVSANTVSVLKVGTCALTANQAGNTVYSAAAQVAKSVVISKGSQTIGFGALPSVSMLLGPISVSATASSGLVVTFTSGTTGICTVAGTTVSFVIVGTCTIRANQSGNTNFNAAPQVAQSFTVTSGPAAQAITGFAPLTPIGFVAGGTFSVSATPGASGNPVTFGTATSEICTVAGNIVTITAPGTCVLTADQAGNATFNPAPQLLAMVAIDPANTTPTLPRLITSTLPPAILGRPYNATIVVSASPSVTTAIVTGLPAGVTAAYDGKGTVTLSGTPSASGDFALTVDATSAAGTVNLPITLTVQAFANNVQSLSAGMFHSCVVFGGGVRCWGANSSGQLGNNSTADSQAAVVAIGSGSGASAVAAGVGHSCAVVNGGVQCWGDNSAGQLGNGISVPSLVPVVAIVAGSGATAVTAGASHSCAVVNGGVRCWGHNTSGELGNGSNVSSPSPVIAIADGSGATAVAAGAVHTCAIVAAGVKCWGNNSISELGNGGTTPSNVPVTTFASASGVTAISASVNGAGSHTCAVIAGGINCWGRNINSSGQLGCGVSAGNGMCVAYVAGSNATAVAAGGNHSCAVIDGGVMCWGKNNAGQLGDGTRNTSQNEFSLVSAIPSGSGVTAITAGREHTCVISSGAVECWFDNLYGRLGNTTVVIDRYATPIPSIPSGSKVTSVTAGPTYTCAAMDQGLRCWGDLFGSTLNHFPTATPAFATTLAVAAAAVGPVHYCAVVDGGVLCRGFNNSGQFGNNTIGFADPVEPTSLAPGSHVSGVASGSVHTCAVVNGGIQCWGENSQGQLGDGTTNPSLVPIVTLTAGSGATAVSSRRDHTCAVINGGVQCWGSNDFGQLGNATTTRSLVPIAAIAAGSGATAISTGSSHTCAIVNGGVRCWGYNPNGQLGNATTTDSLVPVTAIAAGSGATAVAGGEQHTCAIVNGGVQCWGFNGYGQLGNNTFVNSAVPVTAIPAGSNVIAVAVGTSHTCAALNGGVVCWGASGVLGVPATGQPIRVLAAITNFLPPSAPTITGSSFTATSITLTFTPPASNGGSAVTDYLATCTRPGFSSNTASALGNAVSVTITGLATGATYTCSLTASTLGGAGPASNTISATPILVIPPTVAITAPANNATVGSAGPLAIVVNAQVAPSTISKIEIFDGATLLTTNITSAVNSIAFTYTLSSIAAGSHIFTAKVTDSQGATATSAGINVVVLASPTITLNTLSENTLVGTSIDLFANATAAIGSSIAKVDFLHFNGDNALLGTATAAPYTLRLASLVAGTNSYVAKVTDSRGLTATSAPVVVNVRNSLFIVIPFLNGSTANDDAIYVSGTVWAPPNSAVNVNGQLATVTSNGQFFLNDLNLKPGVNAVTATVTAPDGQTANHVITITRSAVAAPFIVTVASGGIATAATPYNAAVTIENPGNTPFATITLQCNDPAAGATLTAIGAYQCGFTAAGVYSVRVTVRSASAATIYSVVKTVTVKSPETHISTVRGVYTNLLDRLSAGNTVGTTALFTEAAQAKYSDIFSKLAPSLATYLSQIGQIGAITAADDHAEIVVIRTTGGVSKAYSIYLLLGGDGIWRIESM